MKSFKLKLKLFIAFYTFAIICAATIAYESNNQSAGSNAQAPKKLKFGAKIANKNKLNANVTTTATATNARSTHEHAENVTASPRLPNRAANNNRSGQTRARSQQQKQLQQQQQQITQYNIPIVNKNYAAALAHEPQREAAHRSAAMQNGNIPTRNNNNDASEKLLFTTNIRANNGLKPTDGDSVGADGGKSSAKPVSRSKTGKPPIMPTAETTLVTTVTSKRPEHAQQFQNPFELISQSVWNLFNPTNQPVINSTPYTTTTAVATTSRKPPKKYKPTEPTAIASHQRIKEEKQNYRKMKTSTTTTTTTNRPTHNRHNAATTNNDGPFRIALPTLFNIEHDKEKRATAAATAAATSALLRQRFECPRESEVRFQLFPKICKKDDDCAMWERDELCCEIFGAKSCVSGVPKPLEEAAHEPILGLIPRKCPTRPLAELWWDVQECHTDMDCWPRVCCPDGRRRYCRTSQPELETVPVPVKRSFNYLSEYLECTAPPPRIFDLHPKACTSTLDCFPNVCCQEAGLRHCRPPKKSLLTLMANFLNVDFVKRLTQNIVIK